MDTSTSHEPDPSAARSPTPSRLRSWGFFALVALATAGLDLGSKAWAMRHLAEPVSHPAPVCFVAPGAHHWSFQHLASRRIDLVRGYLDLQYTENCAGAFGFLRSMDQRARWPVFLVVGVIVLGFVLRHYQSIAPAQRLSRVALPLVLGGAIGNLADRVGRGYVVDFIHAHWRTAFDYPTFNVADMALVVGLGLLLLEAVLGYRKRAPSRTPASGVSGS
jgi:signal peptidase II